MNRILVFILTAVMAAQSLGLSYVALPDMNTSFTPMASQADSNAMPCHDQMLEQILVDALLEFNSSAAQSEMEDCCAQTDCSCCWGCAGLLNVQLNISPNHPPLIHLQGLITQMIISPVQSLYRPPIFV